MFILSFVVKDEWVTVVNNNKWEFISYIMTEQITFD